MGQDLSIEKIKDFIFDDDDEEKYKHWVSRFESEVENEMDKYDVLRDMDLFVLDMSLLDSTIGTLISFTAEDKMNIYNEVKKVGFSAITVGSFSHMTNADDEFIKKLKENKEDFSKLWGFSQLIARNKRGIPDVEKIPAGLIKMKEAGVYNGVLTIDVSDTSYDAGLFPWNELKDLVKKRIMWCHENLHADASLIIEISDLSGTLSDAAYRVFALVEYLAKLPLLIRPRGIAINEPSGSCLPEECEFWAKHIRMMMDKHKWKGHLLCNVSEKFGLAHTTSLKALAGGCNGIWASVCGEGPFLGSASSTVTIMNLIRLGNRKVLERYQCKHLRKVAANVTKLVTKQDPPARQVVYGSKALRMPLDADLDLDLDDGEVEKPVRVTPDKSLLQICARLKKVFGEDPNFNVEIAKKMKQLMQDDKRDKKREEYQSPVGLAVLYKRAGGTPNDAMTAAIEEMEKRKAEIEKLVGDVKKHWDEFDLKDRTVADGRLEFDSFYIGFMSPYIAYRSDDCDKVLQILDIDDDDSVDWEEFKTYVTTAINDHPEITDDKALLDVTWTEGIIPAMRELPQPGKDDGTDGKDSDGKDGDDKPKDDKKARRQDRRQKRQKKRQQRRLKKAEKRDDKKDKPIR